jgi:outer membrane protein assembly factor BamB
MKNRELRHTSERSILGAQIMIRVAFGAAVFCLALSIMMIINHLQVKAADPLNNPVLMELKDSLQSNPKDVELKQNIRSLDLLARRAVFTSQHMLRTGGYLLFAGVALLIGSLKVLQELRRRFPYAGRKASIHEEIGTAERSGLIIGGVLLVLITMAIAFIPGVENEKEEKEEVPEEPVLVEEKIPSGWPCFRGPMGLGISYSESAPTSWNGKENKNIIWKTELPEKGDNSPVIWKDKIFLSSATPKEITILCISRKDGSILWQKKRVDIKDASTPLPEVMPDVGHVASSMTVDENGVFAIFSSGDVVAFDHDGKVQWVQKLGPIHNPYGHSSSLITWQGKLFVQIDQEEEKGNVYALDSKSGKLIWKVDRVKLLPCWSTPIIISTASGTQLVVIGNPDVFAYDPGTGKQLWTLKCMSNEVAPSPAYEDGMVFLANEYVSTMGLDIMTTPGKPVKVWEQEDDLPDVTSPLAAKGLLFVGTVYGVVSCYDAKTGERYWQFEFDEGFYSSPVYAAGNIYITDKAGNTHVIAAEKEYKLVGTSVLGDKVMATPAIVDGRIYLRGAKHLYCIGTE